MAKVSEFNIADFIKEEYNTKKFKRGTSLLEAIPEIVGYWDYDRNELEPSEYTFADKRKAWFICDNGHRFERTISGMRGSKRRSGSWCKFCGGTSKLTNSDIDNSLVKLFKSSITRVSNYIDNDSKLDLLCHSCNKIWSTSWQSVRAGSRCPTCRGIKSYTQEEVDNLLTEENRGIKRIGKYKRAKDSIEWECKRCGHRWMNSWWSVNSENRNQGCTFCDDPSRINNDIIDSILEDCNRPIKRVDEYINSRELMKWKCLKCDKTWSTKWSIIRSGSGCIHCQPASKGEIEIESVLSHYNIPYDKEVWFDDLKNIRHLRFDFGLYGDEGELKCLIEYDGIQHFRRWNKQTVQQFEDLKKRDGMKDDYCEKNGIRLVRIPYWDFEYIDTIISDLIESIYCKRREAQWQNM